MDYIFRTYDPNMIVDSNSISDKKEKLKFEIFQTLILNDLNKNK